ncbi:hypothetical protein QUF70_11850 [Desulfobacterales bacterium HSG17]|nr:hypothetical protein [Desulfobacterales bacterium HSG17]
MNTKNTKEQSNTQTGGIHAKNLKTENLVDGVQVQGGHGNIPAGLAELANAVKGGGIHADNLEAKNTVTGLQYIADPQNPKQDELLKEVAALRENIEKSVKAGEITDKADAEDIQGDLVKVEKELALLQPKPRRIVSSLKNVTEIMNETEQTLKAGGKVQAQAIKLAPTAAAIYAAASAFFGV